MRSSRSRTTLPSRKHDTKQFAGSFVGIFGIQNKETQDSCALRPSFRFLSKHQQAVDFQRLFFGQKVQKTQGRARMKKKAADGGQMETAFAEVVRLIEQARQRAYQAVNTELVGLYWQIGEYISGKLAKAEWGEGVVDNLALHLARTLPGQRGFTRRNLFRMRQFFETYRDDKKVTALLTQLPWTHNLIILTQAKRPEEREFYLRMAAQQRWGSRELERQFRLGAFEHAVLTPPKCRQR